MRYFFAIVLPPLAVLSCGKIFSTLLNIILCCFCWVPGIIHALFVVKSYNDTKNFVRIERAIIGSARVAHEDSMDLPRRLSAKAMRMRVERIKSSQDISDDEE